MDITKIYEIKIEDVQHFVYEGTCDGIPTKWVTKSKWDRNINFRMINNEFKYFDTNGNEILVFEEDDIEYKYIRE